MCGHSQPSDFSHIQITDLKSRVATLGGGFMVSALVSEAIGPGSSPVEPVS